MNVFVGILESACMSDRVSVRPFVRQCVCVQLLSFCQSAGGCIKSHLVTALVYSRLDIIHTHMYTVHASIKFMFPNQAPVFTCLQYKSFENTVGTGEIAHYEGRKFSFSHIVFYPFGELPVIFLKVEIVVCKFFQRV